MDPNICLTSLMEAIADGEYNEAAEYALFLLEWLADGGFEPEWPDDWTHIDLPGGGNFDDILGEIQWASPEYTAAQMDTDVANLCVVVTWLKAQYAA